MHPKLQIIATQWIIPFLFEALTHYFSFNFIMCLGIQFNSYYSFEMLQKIQATTC